MVWQELPNLSKQDIVDAVGAADTWLDSAASSYNSALPVAFRTNASAGQKALMLTTVAAAQYLLDDPDAAKVFQIIAGMLVEAANG
jgi:hypothetical protein